MAKLAILSAVTGDFLRVSVSPVSGEKSQDPLGPLTAIHAFDMTIFQGDWCDFMLVDGNRFSSLVQLTHTEVH